MSGRGSKGGALQRFVTAHGLTVVGEWAAVIGLLVHAYRWGGSSAVGLASLAVLFPPIVGAPLAAWLTDRHAALTVRLAGFAVQVVGYGAATVMAAFDLPTPAVVVGVAVGLLAINTLRPTGAVLMPRLARSTGELVSGNLLISYCDSSSALVGPFGAALLEGVGGSTAVFAACTGAAVIAGLLTAWRPGRLAARSPTRVAQHEKRHVMRSAVAELRERKWAVGVLGVSSARNVVVGAFDVLLVIVALKVLDLGDGGPGLLSGLVGVGAVFSALVATIAVRRAQLRRSLIVALLVAAALCLAVGAVTKAPVVFIALPLIGVCLSLMDNLSRMLLQRSTGPQSLGPLFACLGFVGGAGQFAGSVLAQIMVAVASVEVALLSVGVVLVLIAGFSVRALKEADQHAEVPVVEMALLGGIPMFAPLPALTLETVARAGEPVYVAAGDEIIRQGESGDVFYAVADGEFDIEMNGVFLRSAPRGDFFGEVALLSNTTRTATVRARTAGELLAIHRDPFLVAITGHDVSHGAALDYVAEMDLAGKMHWTSERAAQTVAAQQSESASTDSTVKN